MMEGLLTSNTGVICNCFQSDGNLHDKRERLMMFDKWEQRAWKQTLSMMLEMQFGSEMIFVHRLTSSFKMSDAEHATDEMHSLSR